MSVALTSLSQFDPAERRHGEMPEGLTIAEMIAQHLPEALPAHLARADVVLVNEQGEWPVSQDLWRHVRPKSGVTVVLRMRLGGKNFLRAVLTIVVIAAAVWTGGAAAGLLGFVEGSFAYSAVSAATTFAVSVAGTALVNALVPLRPPSLTNRRDSPTYALSGTRNASNPWGVVPVILGRHRVYPLYGANPYTEVVGDDQYMRLLFVVGYGPLAVSDLKIGETPIDDYDDVEYNILGGYPDDPELALFPAAVLQEDLSVDLTYDAGFVSRTTQPDVTEASVDFVFPRGLGELNDDGNIDSHSVVIEIQYRPTGGTEWFTVKTLNYSNNRSAAFRRGYRWTFPTPGQYDVRIRRTTPNSTESSVFDDVTWSALRGFRTGSPIDFPFPLTLIEMRIRATEQLYGVIDTFNCMASSIVRDWESASGTWIERETANNASLFRHVLQGPAMALPRTDDQLDLEGLAAWHEDCVANGYRYNRVHDYDASIREVLSDIATAGRASPSQTDGRWSVALDRPQSVAIGAITPRNSHNFSGEINYRKIPDAFRVVFIDETNGYVRKERIVERPGLVGEPTVFELIEFPGETDPVQVWIKGRLRFAELMARAETYFTTLPAERMIYRRGDLAYINHNTLTAVMATGQVRRVDGLYVSIDEEVTFEAGTDYMVRFTNAEGESWGAELDTPATEATTDLLLAAGSRLPAPGDVAMVGPAGRDVIEGIVKDIEAGQDMSGRLTLVPHAPNLVELAEIDEVPPWDGGGTGGPGGGDVPEGEPAKPIILELDINYRLNTSDEVRAVIATVIVSPGAGGAVPTTAYNMQYRSGASDWESHVTTSTEFVFDRPVRGGDNFEIRVRAIGANGAYSAYTYAPLTEVPENPGMPE